MATTVFMSVTDKARESRLARLSEGIADPGNREELEVALMDFLAAAMRGASSLPAASPSPSPPKARQTAADSLRAGLACVCTTPRAKIRWELGQVGDRFAHKMSGKSTFICVMYGPLAMLDLSDIDAPRDGPSHAHRLAPLLFHTGCSIGR